MRKSELEKDAGGRIFSSTNGETRLVCLILEFFKFQTLSLKISCQDLKLKPHVIGGATLIMAVAKDQITEMEDLLELKAMNHRVKMILIINMENPVLDHQGGKDHRAKFMGIAEMIW